MGMFDTVQWSDPLPFSQEMKDIGLDKNDWSFQTKDLDNTLSDYIVQGNQLFLKKYNDAKWADGDSKSETVLGRFGHHPLCQSLFADAVDPDMIIVGGAEYIEPIKYTGTLILLDCRDDVMDLWDCKIEFKVEFVDGILKSIDLYDFQKNSNQIRIKRNTIMQERIDLINSLWYNKFIFHTKPYRWLRNRISRKLYKIGTLFHSLSYKIP
jgi:hypothetical protein